MEILSLQNFQNSLPQVMQVARQHPVEIRDNDGTIFVFEIKQKPLDNTSSPFDIEGINLQAPVELDDVINAVKEGRERF